MNVKKNDVVTSYIELEASLNDSFEQTIPKLSFCYSGFDSVFTNTCHIDLSLIRHTPRSRCNSPNVTSGEIVGLSLKFLFRQPHDRLARQRTNSACWPVS